MPSNAGLVTSGLMRRSPGESESVTFASAMTLPTTTHIAELSHAKLAALVKELMGPCGGWRRSTSSSGRSCEKKTRLPPDVAELQRWVYCAHEAVHRLMFHCSPIQIIGQAHRLIAI